MDRRKYEALESLVLLSQNRGYLLFEDIMGSADKYELSISDINWLSSAITTRGILIYDEAPTGNVASNPNMAIKDTVKEMSRIIRDKKWEGLTFAYYLSRCNDKAVRSLGYKNFTDAFKNIGLLINEKADSIKNMRDEFDPYFDNGRRGWYQRQLSPSRQELFDMMKNFKDEEVEQIVKDIISRYTSQKLPEEDIVSQEFSTSIRQSRQGENKMSTKKDLGVIYILTNPSFPDYIKIGYTQDLEKRLVQLNRSECIPFAFQVYAIYHATNLLQDEELHSMIDSLNPNLKSIDTFDGKTGTREFYKMTPEDGYAILKTIAKFSGTEDRLQRIAQNEYKDFHKKNPQEESEKKIGKGVNERRSPFSFEKCGIPIGSLIELVDHPEYTAVVGDDRHVEYNGEKYSLTGLAVKLLKIDHSITGPAYWTYQGKILLDIRREREAQGLYK